MMPTNLTQDSKCELIVAWLAMFFMLLFSLWTLAFHAATFGKIPWQALSWGATIAFLPAVMLVALGAWNFANAYAKEVKVPASPTGLRSVAPTILFIAATALSLIAPTYGLRFGLALALFSSICWLTRQQEASQPSAAPPTEQAVHLARYGGIWLAAFAVIAVTVTVATHRSDLDDSTFLQIADQTLRFPTHAPLTFDASLGFLSEPFRFAPYRLSSYESFVAFITERTGLNLLTVYYLLLPGLTSALTIAVAYLFARWFLPSGLAVLATGIFLLIMLAWGESHVAYGNRVFVRLFQGKGLLIALTTPMSVVAGLLLLRRPSPWHLALLALSQVAAIGVSSSGLVCTVVTTALLVVTAIRRDVKAFVFASGLLTVTLIYPAILAAWLKFFSGKGILLSEIGTYLPINASLGLGIREVLSLTALALGVGALGPGIRAREYGLLAGAVLLLVFNPWASQLLSSVSSRNMSWRLAWAAPLPILLSIAMTAVIAPLFQACPPEGKRRLSGSVIGVMVLLIFLAAARWTLVASNNANWNWPTAKLPIEYHCAKEISTELSKLRASGVVLADRGIGAWLPLVAPDLKFVMPGHTYSVMLQTILPSPDFKARMLLYNAANGQTVDFPSTVDVMKKYRVATLVIAKGANTEKTFLQPLLLRTDMVVREAADVANYRIFCLNYAGLMTK